MTTDDKKDMRAECAKIYDAYMETEEGKSIETNKKVLNQNKVGTTNHKIPYGDYLLQPTEIFARAFERWAYERLPGWKESGLASSYGTATKGSFLMTDKTWEKMKDVLDEVFSSEKVKKAFRFIMGSRL
jgi:hypothetical protein